MLGAMAWLALGVVLSVPPTWRFKDDSKTVKVVVLAGSIGAYRRQPYAKEIARLCTNTEVKNLSKVGAGAWGLKKVLKEEVIRNRRLDLDATDREHWLVYGGGLNSVGTPASTNYHTRNIFVIAHGYGMKVVGLTLTPWGDDRDRRWRGITGLRLRRATQRVTDFVMGRLTPTEAFGSLAAKRPGGADAPWDAIERPDVAVDLLDSPLRDSIAAVRDIDKMRAALERDRDWRRAHRNLDDAERAEHLEADAKLAAEIPQWYMRAELRSFDHTHPNAAGHRVIGATMCPALPASWGCQCE